MSMYVLTKQCQIRTPCECVLHYPLRKHIPAYRTAEVLVRDASSENVLRAGDVVKVKDFEEYLLITHFVAYAKSQKYVI